MTTPVAVQRLAEQLGRLLLRSTRAGLYDELTDGVDGVNPTTYPVLSGLARLGPTTPTRLAEATGLDRTVVTKYAAALQRAGLLTKTSDPNDGRMARIALTRAGAAAVHTTRGRLHRILGTATADWESGDVDRLAGLLERLVDGFEATRT